MIRGAVDAGGKTGLDVVLTQEVSSDSDRASLARVTQSILEDAPDLDAIISASPNATMVVASALEAAGRSIGPDFDVFSKETVPFLRLFRPGILTLREDIEKAGLFLAKAAMEEVAGARKGHMQALDQPEFLPPEESA